MVETTTKNPDRVMSVGDDVVGPWYDKVIAHRKKMGKTVPERKHHFINQEEFHTIKHHIHYQNKD